MPAPFACALHGGYADLIGGNSRDLLYVVHSFPINGESLTRSTGIGWEYVLSVRIESTCKFEEFKDVVSIFGLLWFYIHTIEVLYP